MAVRTLVCEIKFPKVKVTQAAWKLENVRFNEKKQIWLTQYEMFYPQTLHIVKMSNSVFDYVFCIWHIEGQGHSSQNLR